MLSCLVNKISDMKLARYSNISEQVVLLFVNNLPENIFINSYNDKLHRTLSESEIE